MVRATKVFLIKVAFQINRKWKSPGKNEKYFAKKKMSAYCQWRNNKETVETRDCQAKPKFKYIYTRKKIRKKTFSRPLFSGFSGTKCLRCALRLLRLAGNQLTHTCTPGGSHRHTMWHSSRRAEMWNHFFWQPFQIYTQHKQQRERPWMRMCVPNRTKCTKLSAKSKNFSNSVSAEYPTSALICFPF